jgi:hypothetical protein
MRYISKSVLLWIFSLMVTAPCFGGSTYTYGGFTYTVTNGTATITGHSNPVGEIVIPETVGGYPISTVALYEVGDYNALTGLVVPDGVQNVDLRAVGYALTSLDIGISVTNLIGFSSCHNLTNFTISAGNPAYSSMGEVLFNGDGTELISYPAGRSGHYTVPTGVVAIAARAFWEGYSITGMVIPDSVGSIGDYNFYGSALTNVFIGSGVTNIGRSVFGLSLELTNISVSAENSIYSSVDGVLFDKNQTVLILIPGGRTGEYKIPSTVTNIARSAVFLCINLTDVTIPNSVTAIGDWAFWRCHGLTNISIPDSVASIGERAFEECDALQTISLGGGLSELGLNALAGCPQLTNITVAAQNLSFSSRDGVLFDKAQATLIAFPSGIRGTYSTPQSVTTIGPRSFGSDSMEAVILGSGVTNIGDYAFEHYGIGPRSLLFRGAPPAFIGPGTIPRPYRLYNSTGWESTLEGQSVGLWTEENDYFFVVTNSMVSITGTRSPFGDLIIPDTIESLPVNSIGESAFGNTYYGYGPWTNITSVAIPSGITSIGRSAFQGCTSLTNVAIPEGVSSIAESTFGNCRSLISVTIPNGVTNIGSWAFSSCVALKSITIPENISTIGWGAFEYCSSLASVHLPDALHTIQGAVFDNCNSLTSITVSAGNVLYSSQDGVLLNKAQSTLVIVPAGRQGTYIVPNSITDIGAVAFSGCTGITAIGLGSSVTSDVASVLSKCSSVTNITASPQSQVYSSNDGILFDKAGTQLLRFPVGRVGDYTIPFGTDSIGRSAFSGCPRLTNINFPSSMTSIGRSAFSFCNGLTNITIPSSVTSIGSYAFLGCYQLAKITIPSSVTHIESSTFRNCFSLTNLSIPEGVTSIGFTAFAGCSALKDIHIPDSVTEIAPTAFHGCTSLTTVVIPRSVDHLILDSFRGCSQLKRIMFEGNEPNDWNHWYYGPLTIPSDLSIYRRIDSSGWADTFGDRPVLLWPEMASLGRSDQGLEFDIIASDGQAFVVEASDTASGGWQTIFTGTGTVAERFNFTDEDAANHSIRFYRICLP